MSYKYQIDADDRIAIVNAVAGAEYGAWLAVKVCEMMDVEQLIVHAYNSEAWYLYVLRDTNDRVQLIVQADGGADTVYDPQDWAQAVEEDARERAWADELVSLDEIEANAPGGDPGTHDATGLTYADEEHHVCARHNERAQAQLYREIVGIA
jgi:hypothetical protein